VIALLPALLAAAAFDGQAALRHASALAALGPHPWGSPRALAAAQYVAAQFRDAGLADVRLQDFDTAGITRVSRIVGVRDGLPLTDDGQTIDVANVIWCTGYRPGFSWIDLPVLGDRQEPETERGVVTQQPGLYFIGLEFTYAATSATITGVGRDAKHVARHIARRRRSAAPGARAKTYSVA